MCSVSLNGTKVVNQNSTTAAVAVYQGSGGGGETGSVKIVKVDSQNNSQALTGAVFEILDQYGNSISKSTPTASDGSFTFSKLRFDINYYIKEITAPIGYNLDNTEHKFQIKTGLNQGSSYDVPGVFEFKVSDSNNNQVTYDYKNSKITGTIQFNKVMAETNSSLANAEFKLYTDTDNSFQTPLATAVSNELGVVKFNNVTCGSYKIKETKAPEGYNLSPQILTATIIQNGVIVNADPYTVSDTKISGTVVVKKTNMDGKALENAEFTIYDINGNVVDKAMTGIDGIASFTKVEYGNYTVKETKAPLGYNLSANVIALKIADNEETYDIGSISDTQITGSIKITITDPVTSLPIPGATIKVHTIDGKPIENGLKGKTGADGSVEFNNLPYGVYYFEETDVPTGYILNTDKQIFSIETNGLVIHDTLSNTKIQTIPQTGSFIDTKVLLIIGISVMIAGFIVLFQKKRDI